MATDVTSRHLRSGTELQLLVPVRDGFVEGVERNTLYSRRLKLLLEALTESIRVGWDLYRLLPSGPIDQLRGIVSTIWSVQERAAGSQLNVASCFDRSWEEYFHVLVDRTGPLLDAIFMHCQGFEGRMCRDGFDRFASFIRENQLQSSFFFMSAPDLTVDDLRRARKMLGAGFPTEARLGSVDDDKALDVRRRVAEDRDLEPLLKASLPGVLVKLFTLRKLFPATEPYPSTTGSGTQTAESIFDEAVENLLYEFLKRPQGLPKPAGLADWVKRLEEISAARLARNTAVLANPPLVTLDQEKLAGIQGNILEPYAPKRTSVTHGAVLLVQCDDAAKARQLLSYLQPRLSTADVSPSDERAKVGYLNVALTDSGLKRLLPSAAYDALPKEFREGMAARVGLIGDVGRPDHSDFWDQPRINWPALPAGTTPSERLLLSSVDLVITWQQLIDPAHTQTYDAPWNDEHPLVADLEKLAIETHGGRILHVQCLRRWPASHFKLREHPASQPVPRVVLQREKVSLDLPAQAAARDVVPLGEILLGYPDNRGETSRLVSEHREYFADGSFMVLRKLEQHVEAFEQYVGSAGGADLAKERLVGRSNNPPTDPPSNEFDFEADRDGKICPLHSHMRRSNPRTPVPANGTGSDIIPRILRRSFQYGPMQRVDGEERGIMFMAYNASIASQFEVVRRWLNGANSSGLPSTQNDLLTGLPQPSAGVHKVWDGNAWVQLPAPTAPLVNLRWGLYLFVPSLPGIAALARDPAEEQRPAAGPNHAAASGLAIIRELNALPDAQARVAWKNLIEGGPNERAARVWDAATIEPVPARNYGTLIANESEARRILCDDGSEFSVREYYRRLTAGFGPHYLAYDPVVSTSPSDDAELDSSFTSNTGAGAYARLSELPNKFITDQVGRTSNLHRLAYNYARAAMPDADTFVLPELIKRSIAELGHRVLGIAGADEAERLQHLERVIAISRYAFQPYPDEVLTQSVRREKQALREAFTRHTGPLRMRTYLTGSGEVSAEKFEEANVATIGALVGFAAPALACVLGAFSDLLASGELQRLQVRLREVDPGSMTSIWDLSQLLRKVPAPPILYRTALQGNSLGLAPGTKVIIGLSALTSAADTSWLFGRAPENTGGQPHHGCPARDPALLMMSGILEFVLRLPNLRALSPVLFSTRGTLPAPLPEPPPAEAVAV